MGSGLLNTYGVTSFWVSQLFTSDACPMTSISGIFFLADERTDCDPAAWHSIWQEDRDKGFSGTVSVPDRNIYHNVSDRTGTVWNRSSFTGNASAVDFLFTGVHRV